jgi:hypothetical protein
MKGWGQVGLVAWAADSSSSRLTSSSSSRKCRPRRRRHTQDLLQQHSQGQQPTLLLQQMQRRLKLLLPVAGDVAGAEVEKLQQQQRVRQVLVRWHRLHVAGAGAAGVAELLAANVHGSHLMEVQQQQLQVMMPPVMPVNQQQQQMAMPSSMRPSGRLCSSSVQRLARRRLPLLLLPPAKVGAVRLGAVLLLTHWVTRQLLWMCRSCSLRSWSSC